MTQCVATYPLATEQSGLWYLQQLAPDCGAYHLVFSFAATVSSSSQFAKQGFARELIASVAADYAILRTSLPMTADGPQQCVWDTVAPDIRLGDGRLLAPDVLRERLRAATREPFNLQEPPLWRMHCYQTGESSWAVALVVHHVLLDFWSMGLLLQELASRVGLTPPVPMPLDGDGFGAYALKQQHAAANLEVAAPWQHYWKTQLQGAPAVHGLALDRPRAAVQTYEGRSLPVALSCAASDGVKRLAQSASATPFMVLLTVYFVLLHRLSGDIDMVVATPVAGRLDRKHRTMLGQFVNTLAMRCQIDPDAEFLTLLGAVKQIVIDGLRYQECPFAWVVQQMVPQRDASYAPVAQIGFSWERLPLLAEFADFFLAEPAAIERAGPGFTVAPYPLAQQEGQLDLTLEMGGERDGALVGVLKYHEHLWHQETAQEMVLAFLSLVNAAVSDPQCRIADMPLGDATQQATWLSLGVGPSMPLPQTSTPVQIRAQAARTPDAVALSDANTSISYRMLVQRADQLAHRLQVHGVQPQDRVGLLLERSSDLVVAMLGIWFAGAAYVPLEPGFPRERLAFIGADADLRALVSQGSLSNLWPTGIPCLCMDQEILSAVDSFQPASGDVAYLLYTSGSTGQPKGVSVGHRSVFNFLQSMQSLLRVDRDTRLLAVTTPAFDISVLELFLPLLVGATVVVCERDTTMDGMQLAHRLDADGINVMQATPASWKMLIDAGWGGSQKLTALCGGDTLQASLKDALLVRVARLWNMYGPTETTVWSTAALLCVEKPVHLGQAIANTQLYVLDAHQRPVPPGVLGELWIGGEGLALEYWNRPELTQKQFTELPTLPQAGRLYRTGDRVRWTTSGLLEHHGRLDFQVKLRGFRIELGEIETLLRQQEGVSDAVAMVREDRPGDQRLVAYVVGPAVSATLQTTLQAALPAYMVPSAFVHLEALPLTANLKINRKALPVPDVSTVAENFVAPRDALEIQLAQLFCELLGLAQVSIHDGFFNLGGHSLLAMQLVAGIDRTVGAKIPMSTLVQHASVAELASFLRENSAATPSTLLTLKKGLPHVQVNADGASMPYQPLWLFHPIGGNVFCYLELTRGLDPRRPVKAFQAPGLDFDGEADVTVEAMASRYRKVLQEHQPNGPYLLGGWCFGGVIAFELARQLRDSGEIVDGLTLVDTRAPIAANVPSDADDATLLSWFARDLATPFGKSLTIEPQTLRALEPEHMFAHVLSAAKAKEVLPSDADDAQLQRYFEVYLANGIALQTYFPQPDTLPVLLLRASDELDDYGPSLGWSALMETSLRQVLLPGDHNSIMYAPQVHAVANTIDAHYPPKPLLQVSQ